MSQTNYFDILNKREFYHKLKGTRSDLTPTLHYEEEWRNEGSTSRTISYNQLLSYRDLFDTGEL